jgi:Flp pilus assembly secretin CpaC
MREIIRLSEGTLLIFALVAALDGKESLEGQNQSKEKPKQTPVTINGREYDGAIDVVVGQGSLLALEKAIAAPGKPPPAIAIAKPTIADFVIVGSRRIRIVGLKAGVTDLTIKSKNGNYSYRVRVVTANERGKVKQIPPFDGSLEIVAGQDRLVTFKDDLIKPGKPAPFVALGDPNVADFVVLSARRIRVIGKKAGLTDLLIINSDDQVLHYEVQVTAPRK